ncbi:MAG: HesA/MoeB/ThiF family protein [Flavobacteriales bacterium]|nr:HesA/MoeB/ThiF family protein [Flavobacteriales bacterium]
MLNKEDLIQYSKQIILTEIGEKGQLKLKISKVLVIGAGGLGCPVLTQLTTCGIGTIGIVDHDTVSLSNLPRQNLYGKSSIGKSKVKEAIKRLKQLNSSTKFIEYNFQLTTKNTYNTIKNYDLIIDCTDNIQTKYLINDTCILLEKPLVFGAVFKHEGQIAVFNYNGSGTYRCLFPKQQNTSMLNCEDSGVLGIITSIIGAFQVNESLKILLNYGEILTNKLKIYNSLDSSTTIIDYKKKNHGIYNRIKADLLFHEKDYSYSCNSIKEISYNSLIKQINEDIQFIDVREPNESPKCIELESLNIPLKDILIHLNKIEKQKKVVLICNSGLRSKQALSVINEQQYFPNIFSLKNGLKNWDKIKQHL